MFKSVTYEGFEAAPDLRAVCEAVTARLESRRILPVKRINVRWEVLAGRGVEVRLTDDPIGTERVQLSADQLNDRDAAVDAIIRRRMSMLDRFLDRTFDGFETNRVAEGV